jgi:hypothetical protein
VKPGNDIIRRDVISWALYDFANTIYSMNILSLYFAGWLVVDLGFKDIHYSIAFSLSMLAAAFLMPALGHLSDKKKPALNKPKQPAGPTKITIPFHLYRRSRPFRSGFCRRAPHGAGAGSAVFRVIEFLL